MIDHVSIIKTAFMQIINECPRIHISNLPHSSGLYFVTKLTYPSSVFEEWGQTILTHQYRTFLADVNETDRPASLKSQGAAALSIGYYEIVYIGQSSNLKTRWRNHPLRSRVLSEEFSVRWKKPDLKHFRTAKHEEAAFISILDPKLNQEVSGSKLRLQLLHQRPAKLVALCT